MTDQPKPIADTQRQRRIKYGLNVAIAVIAAVGIVVLLNWISYRSLRRGPVRWDLTTTRQYSLSPLTHRVLEKLDERAAQFRDLQRRAAAENWQPTADELRTVQAFHPIDFDLSGSITEALEKAELTRQSLRALIRNTGLGYRVVTLLDPAEDAREHTQRARDLLDEYDRAAELLSVEHINPAGEIARRREFEQSLHARYAPRLAKLVDAIEESRRYLREAHGQVESQAAALAQMLNDPALQRGDAKLQISQAQQFFAARAEAISQALEDTRGYRDEELPNYGGALSRLVEALVTLDTRFYPSVLGQLIEPAARHETTPPSVKDALLHLQDQIKAFPAARRKFLESTNDVDPVVEYGLVTSRLRQPNPLVILSSKAVHVMTVNDLYLSPSDAAAETEVKPVSDEDQKDAAEKQFLGEERLTGALARLVMAQLQLPPKIVFVVTGTNARARTQAYRQLQNRLKDMNLDVDEWDPRNRLPGIDPQAKQPDPMPTVEDGQRAVWVLLPGDPIDAQNPLSMSIPHATLDLVRGRMRKGDGVLAIVPPQYEPKAVDENILQDWGLEVRHRFIVLREVLDRYQEKAATNDHIIQTWPRDLPVTRALGDAGLRGWFRWASPIEIVKPKDDVTYYPLIEVEDPTVWANFDTADEAEKARQARVDFDPEQDRRPSDGKLTVGYAAERAGGGRLVVVADQDWATDGFGTRESRDSITGRLIHYTPAPANHELFVNSVYWLAGLDELIAASARTREVRRITDVNKASVKALQLTLLIGMPLGVLAIGLGVWFTRRG